MKFAAILEYDGSEFCGWQRQSHAPSVQEAVEKAISVVADHETGVICAGRTDTGVHAMGQVIHFETNAERSLRSWLLGINANLPASIVVKKVILVEDDFHARFSARSRTYRYMIINQPVRSALLANRATWERLALDETLMQQATPYLMGEHDFTSYRALACQAKSPIRIISCLNVEREGPLVTIEITANGFLHHMVRNIAGVLMSIGREEHSPVWSREVLEKKDRAYGGVTAPAQGLYFIEVEYDPRYAIEI